MKNYRYTGKIVMNSRGIVYGEYVSSDGSPRLWRQRKSKTAVNIGGQTADIYVDDSIMVA